MERTASRLRRDGRHLRRDWGTGGSAKWYRAATTEWEKMMAKGLYPPDEHEVADARSRASGKFDRRAPQTVPFHATKK
jgi:hypothetical protein